MSDILPEHLGGHMNKTHVDEGALRYMIQTFSIESMLDIGCGPGGQLRAAQNLGLHAIGIDGDFTLYKDLDYLNFTKSETSDVKVCVHDFTEGVAPYFNYEYMEWVSDMDYDIMYKLYDLAWSVEFLEHVDEKYQDNYMQAFQCCKYAIVTHAVPGQAGHHHVNCQPAEYWIETFAKYGLTYDEYHTNMIREVSTMQKPFIQRTGLFFKNDNS